jgi:hypothetical protein
VSEYLFAKTSAISNIVAFLSAIEQIHHQPLHTRLYFTKKKREKTSEDNFNTSTLRSTICRSSQQLEKIIIISSSNSEDCPKPSAFLNSKVKFRTHLLNFELLKQSKSVMDQPLFDFSVSPNKRACDTGPDSADDGASKKPDMRKRTFISDGTGMLQRGVSLDHTTYTPLVTCFRLG